MIATLAGGCFWCLEAVFQDLKGVERVVSGYAGGEVPNPTYEQVCTGRTGHAEVVQVTFDPTVLPFRDLLQVFFAIHDPTTLNQQGADVGTQYRSAIFFHSPEQEQDARAVIREIDQAGIWDAPLVTEVEPLGAVLSRRVLPPGLFPAQPGAGVLSCGDRAQSRQVS